MSSSGGRGNFPLVFQLQVQGDTEVASKFNNLRTTLDGISPAVAKVQTGVSGASTSLTNLGTAAQTSTGGVNQFSGALTSFSGNTQNAIQRTEGFTGALGGFSQANTSVQGGLTNTNTLMGGFGNTTTQTGAKVQGVAETFRANRGMIFALTGIAVAGQEAIGMFQSLELQQDSLNDAQAEVNRLQEAGQEGTKEYTRAQERLADVQRGYQFILKSTISSFTDMIPFMLLLTSSFIDITLKAGGSKAMLQKLGGIIPKITKAFRGLGAAIGGVGAAGLFGALTSSAGIAAIAIAAVGGAIMALAHNFMGFRDVVNGAGQQLGDMLPNFKAILEPMGEMGNQLLDQIKNWTSFGGTASAESQTIKQQMQTLSESGQKMGKIQKEQWAAVKEAIIATGDATVLSTNDQIEAIERLGDDAEDVTFSLSALYQKQQMDQAAHSAKYKDFVTAITTGDQEIMESMGLTQAEYEEFYKQWESELKAFEEVHNASVDKIIENMETFRDRQGEASTSLIDDINKLSEEITELSLKQWDMDDDDEIEKTQMEIDQLIYKLDELEGKVSDMALTAATKFVQMKEAGKEALDAFALEVQAGKFANGLNALLIGISKLPPEFQSNFSEIDSIIHNTAMNNRQKVQMLLDDYGSLEAAFEPITFGAYEFSRAEAEAASSLDELAVAARSTVTDVSQMDQAWDKFVGSLSEEQKQLPLVADAIEQVDNGTLSASQAFARLEAAGRDLSATLGETVTTSFESMKKTIVDLPGDTSAVFGEIGGQIVKLGEVADSKLVSDTDSVTQGLTMVANEAENTASTAETELANNTTSSFSTMGGEGQTAFGALVDYANQTIDVFKTISDRAQTYLVTGLGGKVETASKKFDEIKTGAQTALDNLRDVVFGEGNLQKAFQGFFDYLNNNVKPAISNALGSLGSMFPSFPSAEGGGGSFLDIASANFDKIMAKNQVPGGMDVTAIKTLQTAWSTFSTSFATYYTSISTKVQALQTAFSTLSTSVSTYANSMKTNLGTFVTTTNTNLGTMNETIIATQGWWSGLSSNIATYANSMKMNLQGFIYTTNTNMGTMNETVIGSQQIWSIFSTSISTYANSMLTNLGNFITTSNTNLGSLNESVIATQGWFSKLSSNVATYTNSMKVNIQGFTFTSNTNLGKMNSTMISTQQTMSKLSSNVKTYTSSMKSNIQSFVSSAVSGFKSVASAANSLVSALKKVESAARSAASAASKVRGMQHGGAMVAAQRGFSGIVSSPSTYKGVHMGEGFSPELITVTPLTRGTGNHFGPTANSFSGQSGQPIVNNINVILEGRVIQRFVEKTALSNVGIQI